MKKVVSVALLTGLAAYAQTSIAASDSPTVAPGRTFTCVLREEINPRPGFASCAVDRPVVADDNTTIALETGWRVNGVIAESGDKIFWKAVQTGDQAGDRLYEREGAMTSRFTGPHHAGDVLTVLVSRELVLPRPAKD